MALHLLYITAFSILAFLAVGNLIRNMMLLGRDAREFRANGMGGNRPTGNARRPADHPELLDDRGQVINEPLLVMKSMSVDDAREQLDALYNSSPGGGNADTDSGESAAK